MNRRVVATGGGLIVLAAAFFWWMAVNFAPHSTDPAEVMRTVGTVSGVCIGIGVAMIIFGIFRRQRG